jgi:hypothetical protein
MCTVEKASIIDELRAVDGGHGVEKGLPYLLFFRPVVRPP